MLSESARMSSAGEARFRIDAPNSKPRHIKVIALDGTSEAVVKNLAERRWSNASFFTASAFAGTPPERDFSMPGQRNGIPEIAIFHDLGHVLAGYDTDPVGEIQQAAFQAGFVRNDGFMFLFFAIAQFHLGLKITPIADAEVGKLDIEKVMTALARGAACTVDLSDHWDFWPHMPRPLEEVRAELEIPPLS